MIDYRGVSTITNKFIYWKWDNKLLSGSKKDFWEIVKPETIEKFTMLYDKFRRKIYEGDIVSVWIKHETKTRHISKVKSSNYDGFYINAHPAHRSDRRFRKLSDYCGRYSNDCIIIRDEVTVLSYKIAKYYYKNGELHRDGDKPAIIYSDGSRRWFKNGEYHREGNKPAIIYSDGSEEYWVNGERVK